MPFRDSQIIENIKNTKFKTNVVNNNIINKGDKLNLVYFLTSDAVIDNCIHATPEMFNLINQYRGTLQYTNATIMGNPGEKEQKEQNKILFDQVASPSLFNPFYSVKAAGITNNVPLLDTSKHFDDISAKRSSEGQDLNAKIDLKTHFDDCSIENLVYLSKFPNSPLGQAKYKYTDFMFCRDVGKISNNHMITLRRFAAPVGDNIFYETQFKDEDSNIEVAGDIGRMITWFGTEENKLDSILKYSYKATWEEFKAKRQDLPSQETDAARGKLGGLVNLFSGSYSNAVKAGRAPSALSLLMGGGGGGSMLSSAPYANNEAVNGAMYDKNKIYEPADTIRSTYQYSGSLEFAHEFSLTFNYKLRGYDNINAKSAFLDLLGNILAVTYRSGTFWPGEQHVIGAPQHKAGWNKASAFSKGVGDATGTLFSNLLSGKGGSSFDTFWGQLGAAFSNLGIDLGNINPEQFKNVITKGVKAVTGNLGKNISGMIQNQMGRPSVYAFDSLLSNDVVGTWHVTIGNPLNPIASFGNLIIDNVELTHSGPLGLDDFPTDLSVVVSLKHGMPRDSVDIQRMYTQGKFAIYSKISNAKNIKYDSATGTYSSAESLKGQAEYLEKITNAINAHNKMDENARAAADKYSALNNKLSAINDQIKTNQKSINDVTAVYNDAVKKKKRKTAAANKTKINNLTKKHNTLKEQQAEVEKEIVSLQQLTGISNVSVSGSGKNKEVNVDTHNVKFNNLDDAIAAYQQLGVKNAEIDSGAGQDNIVSLLNYGNIVNDAKNEFIGWFGDSEKERIQKVHRSLK